MLDTKYDHLSVEKDKYDNWLEKGYFTNCWEINPYYWRYSC
jgi:hypothetical protein